jgi:archaellum biogenesis ATPase FlaH
MLYETTKQMVSQTYLYSLKRSSPEALESDLFNSADVIFDVIIERSSDQIINKLSIPKIRGMVPTSDVIKFNVADGVHIDTSKDVV